MEEATFPYPMKADPAALHRLVESLMSNRATNHYVFAAEDVGGCVAITVRADQLPAALRVASRPVAHHAAGAELEFTLTATAEKRAGKHGPRRPLPPGDTAARLAWLERRGAMHGFAILDATATQLPSMFVSRGGDQRGFSLDRTRFTGRLRVTDSDKFTEALRSGVGRGRAFGNGLLFIAAGTV